MQKTKKLLAIGLTCLILMSSFFFASCGGPTYDCVTCKDEGIIDCPSCHVMRCDNSTFNHRCQNGKIYQRCGNCNGKSYVGTDLCSWCHGNGIWRGDKCSICYGNGLVKVDCPKCSYGYRETNEDCSFCENGYIGGSQCSDKSCTLPYSTSKNNGYTYIDCPDCEG